MAAIVFGPCMFVAPLVPILMLVAIPLWPVAIVLVTGLWLVVWPLERATRMMGMHRLDGASAKVGTWLKIVVRPWILFEPGSAVPKDGA